jgi:phosphoserine aminotransferase
MKKYNFNPGPSVLPEMTVKNTADAILNLNGSGLSLMEISHRSKDFEAILKESKDLLTELLGIPSGYSILFLQGGASLQFTMVPFNFLNTKAAFLDTGTWANKAMKEAKFFGETVCVASSKDQNYTFIPKDYKIPTDVDYFHITTNNTIYGTELKTDMSSPVPLFADASSDILSRPMDIAKYDLIYGGAQKNLGPAGVAFVILKNSLIEKITKPVPSMLSYKIHAENDSLYNTPPCVAIYSCLQTLKWLKELGGLKAINKINVDKASLLYDAIDSSKIFKSPITVAEDRSIMNVVFVAKPEYKELEDKFLEACKSNGLVNLKGHRSVGGFRASIYNAMPVEGVKALVQVMKDFEKQV